MQRLACGHRQWCCWHWYCYHRARCPQSAGAGSALAGSPIGLQVTIWVSVERDDRRSKRVGGEINFQSSHHKEMPGALDVKEGRKAAAGSAKLWLSNVHLGPPKRTS